MTPRKPHGGRPPLLPDRTARLVGFHLDDEQAARLRTRPGVRSDYVREAVTRMLLDSTFRPRKMGPRTRRFNVKLALTTREQLSDWALWRGASLDSAVAQAVVRRMDRADNPPSVDRAQISYVVQRVTGRDTERPKTQDLEHLYTLELALERLAKHERGYPSRWFRVMKQYRLGDEVWYDDPFAPDFTDDPFAPDFPDIL